MRRVIIALAGVVLVGAVACGGSAPSATAVPEATMAVHVDLLFCQDDMDVDCVVDVVIGPELEDCVGVAPMRCMVVDGELFYDEIEGFEHEDGYRYRIRMERYDPWGGGEPPADASAWGYRLVEVVEKTRAQ